MARRWEGIVAGVLALAAAVWMVATAAGTAYATELTGPPDTNGNHAQCNVAVRNISGEEWRVRASCNVGHGVVITKARHTYKYNGVAQPLYELANSNQFGKQVQITSPAAVSYGAPGTFTWTPFVFEVWDGTSWLATNEVVVSTSSDVFPAYHADTYPDPTTTTTTAPTTTTTAGTTTTTTSSTTYTHEWGDEEDARRWMIATSVFTAGALTGLALFRAGR